MAYPAGVITRTVTFGPAFELEDGDTAGMQVTFKATRPGVLWMATGQPAVSTQITLNADDGVEQSVDLPVTDQTGWGDGDGNLIVPGEDGHVFLYIVTVIFTQNGRTIAGGQPRSKVIPVPQGDGSPLDLDKLIPLTTPGGTTVSVPDIWSAQIEEAKTAAIEAAGSLESAGATFTRKTTLTPGRSGEELAPAFVNHAGNLITHAALGMPSIATMRVICTDGIIADPLGRFYAYIATDHDTAATSDPPWDGKGGIVLAYADDPLGPWTIHRDEDGDLIIWQDTVVGDQTETPTPLYVPDDPDGLPIYVYYQNQGAGLNQSTLLARSATGLPEDFQRYGIVVQGRGTGNPVWPGDGQSTYLEPQRINGRIIAVHLMGGGDWAQYGRSYSQDGRRFVTDPRRFGHFSHLVGADNARRVSIRSLFLWRGKPWAVVTIGSHTSGFVTAPRQVGFVQLSTDLRRIVGKVHTLADPDIGAGQVLEHDGKLYLFYRSGDAYSAFRCAIAEG